jgi:EpsI family protein
MKTTRFWTVVILLAATALVLHTRGDHDNVPYSKPLSQMPEALAGYVSHDIPIQDDVLAILGKGDFLNRIYTVPAGILPVAASPLSAPSSSNAPIGLFIGYFPSQRTGQSIHSPQNCLPGAGWTFDSRRYTTITSADGRIFHVGEYVISNGPSKQFVLYWYQAHGRSIANEYRAKFYMIADAIRMNRTDGAIVRVISPIQTGEPVAAARARVVAFTTQLTPLLPQFIPN